MTTDQERFARLTEREAARLLSVVRDQAEQIAALQERIGDEALIRRAIADPGQFLPRGDDYTETIPSWSARAVVAALADVPTEGELT